MRLNFRSGVKFTLCWREPHFAKTEAEHLANYFNLLQNILKCGF